MVKVLRDTDGDGRMDAADVWATNLPPVYGIVPARGGVIVACAPDIVFLADRDGDGRAEVWKGCSPDSARARWNAGSTRLNGASTAGFTSGAVGVEEKSQGRISRN